jgi:hypothetical protein
MNMRSRIYNNYGKTVLVIIAVSGLLLTIVPAILNWQGLMAPVRVNSLMLAGTILWFVPAIFLFGIKPKVEEDPQG